ncbi:MAG: hypothetical protein GY906_23995 [bacterium]|nr:hypothetical protein [bacterium]
MALGTKTLTGGGGSEVLLAADRNRDKVLIQLQSNHPTYFGFGETAVTLQGVALLEPSATLEVTGHKARNAINVIAAGNAILGYETGNDVKHRTGQFAGPWPAA